MRLSLRKTVALFLLIFNLFLLIKFRSRFVNVIEGRITRNNDYDITFSGNSYSVVSDLSNIINRNSSSCYFNISKPEAYGNLLWLKNAVVNPQKAFLSGKITENNQLYDFEYGFLTLFCDDERQQYEGHINKIIPKYSTIGRKLFVNTITDRQKRSGFLRKFPNVERIPFGALIVRIEYANPYWVLVDVIDLYLSFQQSGVRLNETCIIIADNHPVTTTEGLYRLVFPCVIKLSQLRQNYRTLILDKLLFRPTRQNSITLNKRYTSLNVINSIRRDVYERLGIRNNRKVDCSFLRVLIVWRRDYQNHPGNIAKLIDRKIANEDEVLQTIVNKLSFVNISDVQLEQISMREQIKLMSEIDVFWGMHGAGHALSVFMRPKTAVVELLPLKSGSNWHMGHLSKLADHHHIATKIAQSRRYQHKPAKNTPDSTFYHVDSETVVESLNKAHDKLC